MKTSLEKFYEKYREENGFDCGVEEQFWQDMKEYGALDCVDLTFHGKIRLFSGLRHK